MESVLRALVPTLAIGATVWSTCMSFASVDGISMQPLINTKSQQNDMILLSNWPVKLDRIKHGDVVVLVSPKNPTSWLVKRVIGLPGDVVTTISHKRKYVVIPAGHCWIEGDNHAYSNDSNYYGAVSKGLLVWKASHIIWPLSRLTRIRSEMPKNRQLIPLDDVDAETREQFAHLFKSKHSNLEPKDDNRKYFVNFLE
jgi:inner membrane protease subunit 2